MKLKKIFATLPLMTMMALSLFSCSKDSSSEENGLSEVSEKYEQVADQLYNYLSTHEGATIEDLLKQLESYTQEVTTEIRNNILYVNIDGYEYMCDPYMVTCPVGNDEDGLDDSEFNDLMNDINAALYPDKKIDNARTIVADVARSSAVTRASNDNVVFLNRNKFFVWDPWNVLQIKQGDISPIIHKGNTLASLSQFSTCDIGFLICHGTDDGRIGIPDEPSYRSELETNGLVKGKDFTFGTIGTGTSAINTLNLKKQALEKFFTGDLSKTILWTAMCFANVKGSVLKEVVNSRGLAAFAGCDKTVYMDGTVQDWVCRFTNLFYIGGYAEDHVVTVTHYPGAATSPISITYVGKETGTYSFEYKNHLAYRPLVKSMNAVDNQPCASITLPYKLFNPANAARSAHVMRSSTETVSVGFLIRNKETGEETEQAIEASTVASYNRFDYKDIISRFEVLGMTDNLDKGTYEYRTYLTINGETTLSEDTYEFTISGSGLCPNAKHPHMIDLGLPSGVKWACCNLDSHEPYEYGGYYGWGELEPKETFMEKDYKFYISEQNYEIIDREISGNKKYDAAALKLGDKWRMPTLKECDELIDNCTGTISYLGEHRCLILTGPNGNSIVLPAAGSISQPNSYSNPTGRISVGSETIYSSGTMCVPEDDNFGSNFYAPYSRAYCIFGTGKSPYTSTGPRYCGAPIRPVYAP